MRASRIYGLTIQVRMISFLMKTNTEKKGCRKAAFLVYAHLSSSPQ